MAAFGQTTTTTTSTPVTVYDQSYRVIDTFGNLIVFDSGYTVTASTTTGRRSAPVRTPMTQITIVRPTGAPQTVAYAASFVVLGVGTKAVYAIATTTSNTLIALNPQVALPAAVTGFTDLALPASQFNVEMGQPDELSILTAATRSGTTTTPRTVKVVRFDGNRV